MPAGKATKMSQANPGIKCHVNTCYYWGSGEICHADKIEVEPPNASNSQMTDCATFTIK